MMWPQEVGPHPYSGGHEDQIVRVNWQDGSLYSPPSGWFHQHFNTGEETVRQLALGLGSHRHRVTFHEAISGEGTLVSIKGWRLAGNLRRRRPRDLTPVQKGAGGAGNRVPDG